MTELLQEHFEIKAVDSEGKKFDRVSRVEGKSENRNIDLVLDINSVVYKVSPGDTIALMLASTLNTDGSPSPLTYSQNTGPSLADKYEYVMCGAIFKAVPKDQNLFQILASFGGLLMSLTGEKKDLIHLKQDQTIYLLIKKT